MIQVLEPERELVRTAVRRAYDEAGLPWPPPAGPAPLDALIRAFDLDHAEIPALTRAEAARYLSRRGVIGLDFPVDDMPLAGFLFRNAACGFILVCRGDPLPRRRYTAAHEFGHDRLHFVLPPAGGEPGKYLVIGDEEEAMKQAEEMLLLTSGSLAEMERQANLFAAELLMPEDVCRLLFERYAKRFGPTPRFIEHHVASDLLVSREAARWRLGDLGLIPVEL
jgi:Zn-dependent peptidase ImmA (M78 family)